MCICEDGVINIFKKKKKNRTHSNFIVISSTFPWPPRLATKVRSEAKISIATVLSESLPTYS